MTVPFLGEIRLLAFPFAPKGYHICDGSLLSIQQNSALFALLGTNYGGNGTTNFGLPDLRGRAPMHFSSGVYPQGTMTGSESVLLQVSNLPIHSHALVGQNAAGNAVNPIGFGLANVAAAGTVPAHYATGAPFTPLSAASIQSSGGSLPHNNMQPTLVLNYCIAMQGIFPSRN